MQLPWYGRHACAVAAVPPEVVIAATVPPVREVLADIAHGVIVVLEETLHVRAEGGSEEEVGGGRCGGKHLGRWAAARTCDASRGWEGMSKGERQNECKPDRESRREGARGLEG